MPKIAPDELMTDEVYVGELTRLLVGRPEVLEPASDGIGGTVTRVQPVIDGPWPQVEISWALTVPEHPSLADVPRAGRFRLPFGREWLALSHYDDPGVYERFEVRRLLRRAIREALHEDRLHPSRLPPQRSVADLWAELRTELDRGHGVRQVGPGRLETVRLDRDQTPHPLTLVADPLEWAALCNGGRADYGLWELTGVLDDDDRFLILVGGGFVRSTREALPWVRGSAQRRRIEERRARHPGRTGWFSYEPTRPSRHSEAK